MKNLTKSNVTIKDSLTLSGKGLHLPNKDFFDQNKVTLQQKYDDYDKKASSGKWTDIKPLWADQDAAVYKLDKKSNVGNLKIKDVAESLYGSQRPIITEHWNNLKILNGGKELMCPICEIQSCSEMDHYIPKELMPEYAVHLSNLIPLCHNCNHDKGTLWLDKNGHRIIFNAYYDLLYGKVIYEVHIALDKVTKLPIAAVCLNHLLNPKDTTDFVVMRTVDKLKICEQYSAKVNMRLADRIEEWRLDYCQNQQKWKDVGEFLDSRLEIIKSLTYNHKTKDIIESLLLQGILDSDEFMVWLKDNLDIQKA